MKKITTTATTTIITLLLVLLLVPLAVSATITPQDDSGGGGPGRNGDDDFDDINNRNATRPTINVTAINNTATLALDDLEELLTSLESNANITRRSIITDLEAIQLAFQNIQGNLSGIIPSIQDEADIR
jgi:hypothetical protein